MNMPVSLEPNKVGACKSNHFVCKISAVSTLGNGIVKVLLTPPVDFPDYSAGQYIELVLPDGTSRPFSIANFVPGIRSLELHIEINPNSEATLAIIKRLQSQQEIQVKSAQGDVGLKPTRGAQVFLAAGTGFAQMKALIEQSLFNPLQPSANDSDASPLYLLWGTETPGQRYMKDLVRVWLSRYPHFHYRPLTWQHEDSWEAGLEPLMDQLIDAQFYACGSASRVYSVLDFLEQQGLCTDQIQSDVFAYAPRPLGNVLAQ